MAAVSDPTETATAEGGARQANQAFYRALTGLDLEGMDALWLHDARVVCIHPGRPALLGWEAVRDSWERIFAATRWMHVEPTNVGVGILGEMAIVTCWENVTAQADEGVGIASVQATNLFRRVEGSWRLIVHHASHVPLDATPSFEGEPQ
jgi:ketosteroid isomerase-like protein